MSLRPAWRACHHGSPLSSEIVSKQLGEVESRLVLDLLPTGDVLFWHANLLHGGSPRKNLALSRKALVCHHFAKGAVTYHDSCHSLRELKIKDGPRRLLRNVKGLELREMSVAEECCGFGGTFSIKFPEVSGGMARTKIDSIHETGAETVVSIDSSCLMQLQGALLRGKHPVKAMHLAEVLACQ